MHAISRLIDIAALALICCFFVAVIAAVPPLLSRCFPAVNFAVIATAKSEKGR
jgi:hypothetical protein